jgi:hypothetical protein
MADRTMLRQRLEELPLPAERVFAIQQRLQRLVASGD